MIQDDHSFSLIYGSRSIVKTSVSTLVQATQIILIGHLGLRLESTVDSLNLWMYGDSLAAMAKT
jgi:hypothetical protein